MHVTFVIEPQLGSHGGHDAGPHKHPREDRDAANTGSYTSPLGFKVSSELFVVE